ncbi:hypothetical protein BV20DRAFT_630903 [Pilatotrama ljubarskyi]|nr:hypothetical protein BV20DRAFT_630903 [Pilatotrama ljubarskyi]
MATPAPAPVEPTASASSLNADPRSDLIEQIFQKVEEESERRAQEQEEYEEQSRQSAMHSRVASPAPSAVPPAAPAAVSVVRDAAGVRERRRGSISVSRFGQATDLTAQARDSPSALPSRTNSVIINAGKTGAFYQAQKYAGSADSFADSFDDEHGGHAQPHHQEESEQVTQMETIAGKVSIGRAVGGIIARRLSRSRTRSRDILATPSGLVIGVSVEEATTEAEHGEGEASEEAKGQRSPLGTAFVYATQAPAPAEGMRSRRSTLSMPGTSGSTNTSESAGAGVGAGAGAGVNGQERRLSAAGWVAKAKDLTKKFRRRSMAVLPQNSSP